MTEPGEPAAPVSTQDVLPVIALVGRPNVGKSTLFNRLTRTQDALVADFPGLTRDRQYGDGRVGSWPYIVVDTGGLSGAPETLDAAMAEQTLAAVREADLSVLMVDARDGLMPVDRDIATLLRREARQVLVCVNKVDGLGEDRAGLDFHELGFEKQISIAAAHNRGIRQLVAAAAELLGIETADADALPGNKAQKRRGSARRARADDSSEPSDEPFANGPPPEARIAFVGRPNVGKSTLINRLLGDERLVAYDQPGTTRDTVAVPFTRAGRAYTLIDTAGVRRRGKVRDKVEIFSIIKTLQAVDRSNVCVMMLDAADGVTEQDLHLLGYILDKGRALVVTVNKWDSLDSEQRDHIREQLARRVEFLHFTRIHYISALSGSGVGDLFKSINRAHASAFIDLSTSRLTRLLEVAVAQHAPPMVNGRRIRLRYAHQGGRNPPIIVVHGRQASKSPRAYERYLVNHFSKVLRLFGTPLKIEFRDGENPYAGSARSPRRVASETGRKRSPRRR